MLHATHNQPSVGGDFRSNLEEKVKAAGMMERFIPKPVEQQLVSAGVDNGLSAEYAENVVAAIAQEKGFVLESQIDHILGVILAHIGARTKGKVDKEEFDEATAMARDLTHGVLNDLKIRKKAKQVMIDNGTAPQSGGVFHHDWFRDI